MILLTQNKNLIIFDKAEIYKTFGDERRIIECDIMHARYRVVVSRCHLFQAYRAVDVREESHGRDIEPYGVRFQFFIGCDTCHDKGIGAVTCRVVDPVACHRVACIVQIDEI